MNPMKERTLRIAISSVGVGLEQETDLDVAVKRRAGCDFHQGVVSHK